PPPPPNVPELSEEMADITAASLRERMEVHRRNPACANCHAKMDPIGFALENFDAVGRWREREREQAIDPRGILPSGVELTGVDSLTAMLCDRPEPFVQTLTEKLLTFALGRGVEHYDAPAVRQVVAQARLRDYRFSAIVIGIVHSVPFQMRSAP
ncbi:MAG: DUF1588 domain-containing protein, partial [Planctomycetales bacterium]|nr:DUF1588 domain-containing protein [Planctomycetales bacterium]